MPGVGYLERLGARYTDLLFGQTSQANKLWRSVKRGHWDYKDLGKALVATIEGYYDITKEVLKGPNYVVRPEYVFFHFKRNSKDGPRETEVPIAQQPQDTTLKRTDFIPAVGKQSLPAGKAREGLYSDCTLTSDRKALLVALNTSKLESSRAGHYTSMIYVPDRNGSPPLVIVNLVIE